MRNIRFRKRQIFLVITVSLLLTVFLLSGVLASSIEKGMISQQAADRWGEGSNIDCAQISCFISVDASFTEDRLPQLRASVDSSLTEASVTPSNPSSKLWIDAYSTETRLGARTERGSIDASVTAVGGHFFRIHTMKFVNGYAFSPDDLMYDRVVLDTDAAWQLFGSFDVAGRSLSVSGKECVVAGVAERKSDNVSDRLSDLAYGEKPRIYISYGLLEEISPDTPISCYEAVLPSPISGFAYDIIKNKINVDISDIEILDNSARYDFLPLTETIASLTTRSMRTNRIIYPYWENIAGVTEDRLAVILFVRIVCAAASGLVIFISAVKFIISHPLRKETIADAKDRVLAFISKHHAKISKIKNKKLKQSEGNRD